MRPYSGAAASECGCTRALAAQEYGWRKHNIEGQVSQKGGRFLAEASTHPRDGRIPQACLHVQTFDPGDGAQIVCGVPGLIVIVGKGVAVDQNAHGGAPVGGVEVGLQTEVGIGSTLQWLIPEYPVGLGCST